MAGVEYQVTKVDPTDPETKGAVYQVNKVTEEVAATLGGKVYRAKVIKNPYEPTVKGKVYQIVIVDLDTSTQGKVYNAIITGDSEAVVVGPGQSPLLLPDAIANSLSYVKAFGGTTQNGVPSGYTPLEYIEMTGAQYLDTGITGYANTNVLKTKINASQVSATCFITFQNPNSGINNLGLFLSSSRWNFQYGSPSRVTALASANTDVSIEATNGIMKINGVSVTGTPASEFSISEPILIGTAINGTTIEGRKFQGKIYYFRWEDSNGNVLFDGVPAKDSNNVAGMYDTVSGRFLTNQGSGSITAGPAITPTPDTPMDIVSNNGTIKVRRKSGLPLDYQKITFVRPDDSIDLGIKTTENTQITTEFYREENIAQYLYLSDTGSSLTTNTTAYTSTGGANWRFGNRTANVTTPVTTKTTYVQNKNGVSRISPTEDSWEYSNVNSFTSTDNLRTGASPSTSTEGNIRYYSILVEESGVAVLDLIPVRRLSDSKIGFYNLVNGDFFEATGNVVRGGDIADPIEIYADGTVETITDSLSNTATAEMLLKVGDYADTQEILSGRVKRNVGIKVLDGTENWTYNNSYNRYNVATLLPDAVAPNSDFLCTHGVTSVNTNDTWSIKASGTFAFYDDKTRFATAQDFKDYLAAQYAAGTPVIVIYPLATETTESVTGQTLQVQAGDNTLEITQASMSGLELEAKYDKEGA